MNSLDSLEIKWFETQTEEYIKHYYNEQIVSCDSCIQKNIDMAEVTIEVTSQSPPYSSDGGSTRRRHRKRKVSLSRMSWEMEGFALGTNNMDNADNDKQGLRRRYLQTNQVTLTYKQTVSYRIMNPSAPDYTINDIIINPFSDISKRRDYKNFMKAPSNAPPSFTSLELISAPTIQTKVDKGLGIGIIAAIAAGGAIIVAGGIFLFCWWRRKGKRKYPDPYNDQRISGRNGQYPDGQPPAQVQLPNFNKDEVSTMVDPSPQYGYFNSAQSIKGYNNSTPSVGTMDPDYIGVYNGGSAASIISDADGTRGSHTQVSKFSGMDSTFNTGALGGQSMYAEDEQSFEAHMETRRKHAKKEAFFAIMAPAGKLGVVIDTPNNGAPIVYNIKETCPIKDQLKVGDKLIMVDDEDVRSMTAVMVSKLISQKSTNHQRKLTVSRVVEEIETSR